MKVDGLRFVLRIPPNLVQRVEQYAQLKRALRLRLFEDAFLQGDKLHNIANIFQRQWLIWGYLGLLTGTAVDKSLSLEATNNYLLRENRDKFPDWMRRCLKALFRLETDGSGVDTRRTERNLLDLLEICHLDAFIEALESLAPLIWSPPQARWKEWLKRCYITTYG
jgi:hypothetical protein